MKDSVTKKSLDDIVNEVLADSAWGREVNGAWVLVAQEPSVTRPHPSGELLVLEGVGSLVSYAEWVESIAEDRHTRNKLTTSFTKEGEPGHALAEHAVRLRNGLRRADGSSVKIIDAFFQLLIYLKRTGRSFTVVFRTFGEDLHGVAQELNAFCEGRHPRSLHGLRFDGSDGEADYRLETSDLWKIGTFLRTDELTSLVMGTLEQPGEGKFKHTTDRSLNFYKRWPALEIVSGLTEVAKFLEERCSLPGTVGLRDNYHYWSRHNRTSRGGKIFFVDRTMVGGQHSVFFDDHIRFADAFIVQPLCRFEPTRQLWTVPLLRSHLCRAEPLLSIPDSMYFIKKLMTLEDFYERSVTSMCKWKQAYGRVKHMNGIMHQFLRDRHSGSAEGDKKNDFPQHSEGDDEQDSVGFVESELSPLEQVELNVLNRQSSESWMWEHANSSIAMRLSWEDSVRLSANALLGRRLGIAGIDDPSLFEEKNLPLRERLDTGWMDSVAPEDDSSLEDSDSSEDSTEPNGADEHLEGMQQ